MGGLLLGIDVGTSGVKTGLFNADGKLLGLGRSTHGVDSPHPGWVQCNPELWWQGVLSSLSTACTEAGIAPAEVGAVGVGVLFPCIVPLDAAGRALYPAILYCDQRSLAQVRAIEESIGREEYQRIIGNMLVPGTCAVTSIAWLRDEQPEAYGAARTFGFANTFVTGRLVGRFCADPTMVGLSGMADIRDPWQWCPTLCERLGLDPTRLPLVCGSAEVVGQVTASPAQQTGLRPGTPVVCGGGDVPVCAVGGGALTSETVVYIAGSTDCTALPMPGPTDDRRWANTAYVPRGRWLGIGAMTSSGVCVEWFTKEFLRKAGPEGRQRMTELASSSPPGSNGVLFLPYLQGERTPVWDPLARGLFVGLTASSTLADLARAVFEGTAFALRQMLECADEAAGGTPTEVRAVGGATRNALWNQIKADVLQRPLDVLEFQETGALGAALLAGVGAGVYVSFAEAVGVARKVGGVRTVEPSPDRSALYRELFDLYCQLYPLTKPLAHALAARR